FEELGGPGLRDEGFVPGGQPGLQGVRAGGLQGGAFPGPDVLSHPAAALIVPEVKGLERLRETGEDDGGSGRFASDEGDARAGGAQFAEFEDLEAAALIPGARE